MVKVHIRNLTIRGKTSSTDIFSFIRSNKKERMKENAYYDG